MKVQAEVSVVYDLSVKFEIKSPWRLNLELECYFYVFSRKESVFHEFILGTEGESTKLKIIPLEIMHLGEREKRNPA